MSRAREAVVHEPGDADLRGPSLEQRVALVLEEVQRRTVGLRQRRIEIRVEEADAVDRAPEPRLDAEQLAVAVGVRRGREAQLDGRRRRGPRDGRQRGPDHLSEEAAPVERTRTLIELGGALRRGRRPRDAREPLRQAAELAERRGAGGLARRAREELLATGARPRRVALTGAAALTPAERRVAQLAADGRSNRAIAQELFVTEKTVEGHLGRAYDKLGIRSRAGLADALT